MTEPTEPATPPPGRRDPIFARRMLARAIAVRVNSRDTDDACRVARAALGHASDATVYTLLLGEKREHVTRVLVNELAAGFDPPVATAPARRPTRVDAAGAGAVIVWYGAWSCRVVLNEPLTAWAATYADAASKVYAAIQYLEALAHVKQNGVVITAVHGDPREAP